MAKRAKRTRSDHKHNQVERPIYEMRNLEFIKKSLNEKLLLSSDKSTTWRARRTACTIRLFEKNVQYAHATDAAHLARQNSQFE
jgi:hypothetical protein